MNKLDLSKYKTTKELQEYTNTLFIQIAILQNENKDLIEKNDHLQKLLKNTEKIPTIEAKSPEEELLIREIMYIDKLSRAGGLNLEETKQLKMLYDSLVSLRRVEKGLVEDNKPKTKKTSPAKLLSIIKNNG